MLGFMGFRGPNGTSIFDDRDMVVLKSSGILFSGLGNHFRKNQNSERIRDGRGVGENFFDFIYFFLRIPLVRIIFSCYYSCIESPAGDERVKGLSLFSEIICEKNPTMIRNFFTLCSLDSGSYLSRPPRLTDLSSKGIHKQYMPVR